MNYQSNKQNFLKKNREKILLLKQNNRSIQLKQLVRSYAKLENRLKAMEEKFQKMTQKSIKIFSNEIHSKPPEKNHATNETDVYYFDDIWSLDI